MTFTEMRLEGAWLIGLEPLEDARGFFARTFCREEFAAHGLNPQVAQCNLSVNIKKGTLRGMHYQATPHAEAKLVRCVRGALYDVIIDLRQDSPTFKEHLGLELSAENRLALYAPEGFAHGFLTLTDHTEVFYQMSAPYAPESACGVRYDDPAFGITWPAPVRVISPRDAGYLDVGI